MRSLVSPLVTCHPAASPSSRQEPACPPSHVLPWPDPVIDTLGHDPRSLYVEMFLLPTLGPTTLLLARHLAQRFDQAPDGVPLDLMETSLALGLGPRGAPTPRWSGRSPAWPSSTSPAAVPATPRRTARPTARTVPRPPSSSGRSATFPPVNRRHLKRLPPSLQHTLSSWPAAHLADAARRRARRVAFVLLETGDDADLVERALHRLGFHPAVCREAAEWAAPPPRRGGAAEGRPRLARHGARRRHPRPVAGPAGRRRRRHQPRAETRHRGARRRGRRRDPARGARLPGSCQPGTQPGPREPAAGLPMPGAGARRTVPPGTAGPPRRSPLRLRSPPAPRSTTGTAGASRPSVAGWLRERPDVSWCSPARASPPSRASPTSAARRACGPRTPPPRRPATLQYYVADPDGPRPGPGATGIDSEIWSQEPNAGHRALAELERQGHARHARHPERRRPPPRRRHLARAVVEIHGTVREASASTCGGVGPDGDACIDRVRGRRGRPALPRAAAGS